MLKGLYFKLHDDNPREKDIIDFFVEEGKKKGYTKIQLLILCISCYRQAKKLNVYYDTDSVCEDD